MIMATKISQRQAVGAIARRETFEASALTGRIVSGRYPHTPGTGRLPEPYRADYMGAAHAGDLAYVVLSYVTPIAWTLRDGTLVVPDVRYSVTTSKHQGIARQGMTRQTVVAPDADLRGADLYRADLRGVDYTGADLRGVDYTGAILDKNVKWA